MHPFYGPSAGLLGGRGTSATGLLSMAAYLAFWAGAIVLARRELDARFPRGGRPLADPAMDELRARYARGRHPSSCSAPDPSQTPASDSPKGARATPHSVTMAVTSAAGVTSNAGL